MHVLLFVQWWCAAGSLFFFPIPDEAPPSRLRGCGQKEEVKLRGGVCRLRGERHALVSKRANKRETGEKECSVWKQSLSRHAHVSKRANERETGEKEWSVKNSRSRGVLVF